MNQNNQTYKHTSVGLIPLDWQVKRFDDIFTFYPTASYSRAELDEDGEIMYVHYGDIHTKFHFHLNLDTNSLPKINIDKLKKYELISEGDLIITDASEDYSGVGKAVEVRNVRDRKAIAGLHTFLLRDSNNILASGFRGYIPLNSNVVKQFYRLATGTKVYSLSKGSLGSVKCPIPPLNEQQKIAAILSTWDKAISTTREIIFNIENRNKSLSLSLLTGKIRLEEFENQKNVFCKTNLGIAVPKDWEIIRVKDVFSERRETSNNQTKYPLYSLTIEDGLTAKTERYERSFLLKNQDSNQYKLVYPNDILFNPMNLRYGAIAKSNVDKIVSVSAYYNSICIKDETICLGYYEKLFKTSLLLHIYDRIAIGSLIEKKRVHLSNFLEMEIPKPTLAEQIKITATLDAANKQLNYYQQKLQQLIDQKKSLIRQLLTGKVRTV